MGPAVNDNRNLDYSGGAIPFRPGPMRPTAPRAPASSLTGSQAPVHPLIVLCEILETQSEVIT